MMDKPRYPTIYLMAPVVFSCTGVIGMPFSSRAFSIVNTASDMAMQEKTDASARYIPGQIRRPKPNEILRGSR